MYTPNYTMNNIVGNDGMIKMRKKNYIKERQSNMLWDEEIIGFCKNIDELSEEIEKASDQLLALRGKRVCEHCHAEIDISVKFCPLCGTEQPEIPVEEVSEVEVVEGEENVEETNAEEEIPEAEKVENEEKTDNEDSSDENA